MNIAGIQLREILKRQAEPVEIWNTHGYAIETIPAHCAAELIEKGRFIGVGNERRVHHVKPDTSYLGWRGTGWRGGSVTTQRIRNDQKTIISAPFHREHRPLVQPLR